MNIFRLGLLFFIITVNISAQSFWIEANTHKQFYSGVSMSSADVNGDGIDDLLILDYSKQLWLGINNGSAQFLWTPLPLRLPAAAYSINVGDIDRNGYNDILISGESTGLNVLYQDKNGFRLSVADNASFFSQAACIYDINQDGWLDFSLCDDNQASRIYRNDKLGTLIWDTTLINLNLSDRNKNGGNYGCVWTDIDWDGDPDFYISKCRPGVDDPRDLRRVNLLYIKDSAGWNEKAGLLGLDAGDQSWISVIQDFDQDGLPDVLLINHYSPSRIFKQNTDHTFTDVTLSSGFIYTGIALQAIPLDVDNDGDLDILVAGTSAELWLNLGDMKFEKWKSELTDQPFSSCVSGDFNQDGFLDVYVSHADILNSPSNKNDRLWLNSGNKNNFISFRLLGKTSNPHGIGARIKLSSGGISQFRELIAGESYGIQNSFNVHFGLHQSSSVDSLVVYWPSGTTDTYYSIGANRKYLITESQCMLDLSGLPPTQEFLFCKLIDTLLNADPNMSSVVWNNGTIGSSVNVKSEGMYYYTALNKDFCTVISNPVSIRKGTAIRHKLSENYTKLLCQGDVLNLKMSDFDQVIWSTGKPSNQLKITESGRYYGQVQGYCHTEYSDTLDVIVHPLPDVPMVRSDTLSVYRQAVLNGNADNLNWYESETALRPLHEGKIFITDSIFQSRSFWVETFESHSYPFIHGGPKEPSFSTSPYHAAFINNQMLFKVYKDIILDSVTLYTDDAGIRQIECLDSRGHVLNQTIVNLDKGKTQVYLGYQLPGSTLTYMLTTNTERNVESFGSKSPRLFRSDQNFTYPFSIEDKLRITSSDKGDSYFYYFYDWVIREQDIQCRSDRIEVPVIVLPLSTEDGHSDIRIVRISDNIIYLDTKCAGSFQLDILNLEGKKIKSYSQVKGSDKIQLPSLIRGIYIAHLYSNADGRRYIFKWIE